MSFTNNIFNRVKLLENKLKFMENKLIEIEEDHEKKIDLLRSHLVKVKNKEFLSSKVIYSTLSYNDLSPERAYKIFKDPNTNYQIIDVSKSNQTKVKISNSTHIPLEELSERISEIPNGGSTIVLIVSEKGLRSIQACEILSELGNYNVSNISGGHLYWPGHKEESSYAA